MRRRIFATLLSLCLVLGLLPTAAFAQNAISYVALGDSITTGYGLGEGEQSFAEIIAAENGYELINLAEDGATSADLLDVIQNEANAATLENADLITITIGGNDLMGALYEYLAEAYNATHQDAAITEQELQKGLMAGNFTLLTFVASVINDFVLSDAAEDALLGFDDNLLRIIVALKQANPDATIIVANQYNPYSHIENSFATDIVDAFEQGVQLLNFAIGSNTDDYDVADVYTVFEDADQNPCNAYLTSIMDFNLDFHPNAYGHQLIAEEINALLTEIGEPGGEDPGSEAPEPQAGGLWVNGENILDATDYTVQCGGGKAVYDPEANTLTLDNATITTAHEFLRWNDDLGYAYIYVDYYEENPMTIILRGENTIVSSSENDIGVFANHLIIKAEYPDAALTISEPLSIIDCVSIVVESGTISANALFDNMTVRGGSVIAEGYGLDGWNSITIEGGTVAASGPEEYAGIRGSKVTISGGTVTTSGEDCGLYALDMTVNGSPTITVEASGPNANGIYARDGLAVSGSPTITATTSGEVGNAIYTNGDVTISGSPTITATAGAGQAAIGAGGITVNDLPYVCTGSAAHIAAGQVAYGLRQEGAPVPDPDPDRPSHDRDDDDDRDPAATTESERNPDGSITTTVTRPDGTTVETTRNTDGSKEVVETQRDGTVITTATDTEGNEIKTTENTDGTSVVGVTRTDGSTSATTVDKDGLSVTVAALSEDAVARGQTGAVSLPMPGAIAAGDLENAPAVTLDLPGDTSVRVEIPVENMTAGTVAVLVTADGGSEIVKTSVATESGVVLILSGGETVKLVDNTKTFADVAGSFWGAEAVTFVTSRELFQGTGAATFDPNAPMDRAMIVTVLARLDGVDTTTGGAWYEAGAQWAMSNGISDGSGLDQNLTREQLAVMLYRYAQYKGCDVSAGEDANILSYADAFDVSEYAIPAMQWACGAGVISGKDGALDPAGSATRAEVAAMLMRFCQFVL